MESAAVCATSCHQAAGIPDCSPASPWGRAPDSRTSPSADGSLCHTSPPRLPNGYSYGSPCKCLRTVRKRIHSPHCLHTSVSHSMSPQSYLFRGVRYRLCAQCASTHVRTSTHRPQVRCVCQTSCTPPRTAPLSSCSVSSQKVSRAKRGYHVLSRLLRCRVLLF